MRKIFTLFAALATLVSVAAGPRFAQKANNMKVTPVHRLTPQTAQKLTKLAIATPPKQLKQQVSFGKVAKIQQAEAHYECTYNVCEYEDYGSDTWFSITTSDNAFKFYFDVLESASNIEVGKTYTLADCDPSFTYVSDNTTYKIMTLVDLELAFTKDTDGKLLVEAECITESGATFHLKYAPLERPDHFTEVKIEDLPIRLTDFAQTNGLFQFMGKNDVYDLAITVKTKGNIAGNWTTADLLEGNNTYLKKNGLSLKLCDVELQVASLGAHNFHVDGKMYSFDGNVYTFSCDYIEPTIKNLASITAKDLDLNDEMFEIYKGFYGYGLADLTASNDDYEISGSLFSYTTLDGHYDDQDHLVNELFITNVKTGEKTDFFTNDLEVKLVDGSWTVKGKVLCWDNTEYTLDLYFTIPDIKGEKDYTSTYGELEDRTADLGAFKITALDEEYNEFSVILPGEALVSGHYDSLSEPDKDYCYIYFDGKIYDLYSANFELEVDGESFTLKGTCQGGDQLWNVNVSGIILSNADPFDATYEDGEVDVNFTLDEIVTFDIVNEGDNYAYLEVKSKERNDVWVCMFIIDGNELPAGEYPINLSYMPGTVQPGLIDESYSLYPTMYFRLDEAGYAGLPVWYCNEGVVNVAYDEKGNIVVDCEAYNTNYVRVHVTVNAQGTGIEQLTNGKEQKDGKFLENSRIVIRRNGQKFNVLGQQLK